MYTTSTPLSDMNVSAPPLAYSWHEETFELIGAAPCQLDPLEFQTQGKPVWLVPARATQDVPLDVERDAPPQNPECAIKYVNVRAGDVWQLKADYRGSQYWLPDDTCSTEPHTVTKLGPLPEGVLLKRPAKTQAELAAELRAYRDGLIASNRWILERHSDELAAEGTTTLSKEQYRQWLGYMQALRDLPKQEGFPWDGGGEHTPWPERPS